MKEKEKYWYKFYIGSCPVCGSDQSYRIRVYSDKPLEKEDRYVCIPYTETYDYCMGY